MNWVPMVIEHEGRRIPARYVRVRMLDNPEVFGTMGRDSPIYRGDIHAEPCRDMGPAAEYTREELQYFRADFRGRRQVDEALARLGDISLAAEVRRYRASQEVIKELEAGDQEARGRHLRPCRPGACTRRSDWGGPMPS